MKELSFTDAQRAVEIIKEHFDLDMFNEIYVKSSKDGRCHPDLSEEQQVTVHNILEDS